MIQLFPPIKAIRSTAKHSLSPVWPQAFGITFFVFGLLTLPGLLLQFANMISNGFLGEIPYLYPAYLLTYMVFVISPIFLGVARWVWIITAQKEASVSVCFFYFSSAREYLTALKLAFAFLWRLIPLYILYKSPTFLKYADLSFAKQYIDLELCLKIIGIVVPLLALLLSVMVVVRLFHLPFVIINHPARYLGDNVKEAAVISKKTRFNVMSLIAANGGWFLLSLLLFPLPYTLPYLLACWAVMTRFSINYCLK